MSNDKARLLKETLDLADMLASAEMTAGKALEQVAKLRRHYLARMAEWQKARGLESLPAPVSEGVRVPPSLTDSDGDGDTAAERHGAVALTLKRAEENRDARVEGMAVGEGEKPGGGTRVERHPLQDDHDAGAGGCTAELEEPKASNLLTCTNPQCGWNRVGGVDYD